MLNIKRKILVSRWIENTSASTNEAVLTFGKVNPVKMIQNGYSLMSQDLEEFVLSEEEFAIAAEAVKKGDFNVIRK